MERGRQEKKKERKKGSRYHIFPEWRRGKKGGLVSLEEKRETKGNRGEKGKRGPFFLLRREKKKRRDFSRDHSRGKKMPRKGKISLLISSV